MRGTIILIAIVTATAGRAAAVEVEAAAPLPGRDTVAPMKPDWCAGWKDDGSAQPSERLSDAELTLGSQGFSDEAMIRVAQAACAAPDDQAARAQVARWRQKYVNLTGLSEKDDRAAMKLRLQGEAWVQAKAQWCQDHRPDEEAGLDAKAEAGAQLWAAGCPEAEYDFWFFDKQADPPSEVHRAVLVESCLDRLFDEGGERQEWPSVAEDYEATNYMRCGMDARALDKAKLDKDLAGVAEEWRRFEIRRTFARAKAVADHLTDAYKKKAAKDAAWQKLLFDAPQAGWAAWEKAVEPWKSEVQAAFAFEAQYYAASKKATAGCVDTLEPLFRKYLASRKPKSYDDARSQFSDDPVGYLLASHLTACYFRAGSPLFGTVLLHFTDGAREHRGPRQAAYYAAMTAYNDVVADRAKFPLDGDAFNYHGKSLRWNGNWQEFALGDDATTQLATAKAGKDGNVKVTFKTLTWKEEVKECHDTNRLWGVDASGHVLYQQECKSAGMQTRTSTEDPILVPAPVAGGLRAGQVGLFKTERDAPEGATRWGFPLEVWSDAKHSKIVSVLGVELK